MMCPNCKLSKCPECFAAEQKRLKAKDELSKQIGRLSSPADWEEDTSIGFFGRSRGQSFNRDTGGGTRVIRKHILEDSPLNGDD